MRCMCVRTWAERVDSIPMTRGNWPEGGEGHLLPEGTGKAGCGVWVKSKTSSVGKMIHTVEMMSGTR